MSDITFNTIIYATIAIIIFALIAGFFYLSSEKVFAQANTLSEDTKQSRERCNTACEGGKLTQNCKQWQQYYCTTNFDETTPCWKEMPCESPFEKCDCITSAE